MEWFFSNNVKISFNFRNKFCPSDEFEGNNWETELQFVRYWISRKMDKQKNAHVFEELIQELD